MNTIQAWGTPAAGKPFEAVPGARQEDVTLTTAPRVRGDSRCAERSART